MGFERHYGEFWGKRGTPRGKEECLMCCVGGARGVLMVIEECRMKLRGVNRG